ncbi:type II toxin-antitoxin system death-on-curing family toxin (plasmid) [Sinorhizobium meliloti]|nr:type II toxin-antitoxin system death-on-curing family toxin [Sinorhizobium meliloti]
MPNEPFWLPAQAVIDINQETVAATGEDHVLLFPEKLDGALARPRFAFYYDEIYNVVTLSVNLMMAIGQAHAFEQGNKRTAFTSGLAFLYDNGFGFSHPDSTEFAQAFEAMVINQLPPQAFEHEIVLWIEPLPDDE